MHKASHLLSHRVQDRLNGLGMEDRHGCNVASFAVVDKDNERWRLLDSMNSHDLMRAGSLSSPIYAVNYIIGIHVTLIAEKIATCSRGEPAIDLFAHCVSRVVYLSVGHPSCVVVCLKKGSVSKRSRG